MSILKAMATFAARSVVEGTVIALGGEAVATLGSQVHAKVRGHFKDHSRLVLDALSIATEQAFDTLEVALAGSGLLDVADSGDSKGLEIEIEALLEDHRIDGTPLDRAWRRRCLRELKTARKSGMLRAITDPAVLEQAIAPFTRFEDQGALLAAEESALADIATLARTHEFPTLAEFFALRSPRSGTNLLALAVRHHFQCAIPRDHELFATLTHAQLRGLESGQRDALDAIAACRAVVAEQRPLLEDGLRRLDLIERHLRLGDGLSLTNERERRLVKEFRDRLRALPTSAIDAIDLERFGRFFHAAGEYELAAPLLAIAANQACEAREAARAKHSAFVNALERRDLEEATALLRDAAELDPTIVPFDPIKRPILRVLGAGGFGSVVLCGKRHLQSHRSVFKMLRTMGIDRDPEALLDEARTLEAITHRNVIRILDADVDTRGEIPAPYIEMEHFDGQDLESFVKEHGALAVSDAVAVARQIALGLAAAHAQKIWHRDLKPSNVLVRRVGAEFEVKLIDFGLAARPTEMAGSLAVSRAGTGTSLIAESVVGTLGFAAPEQLDPRRGITVGPYSDLFGFGRTMCFALFQRSEPLRKDWTAIPAELADILETCLHDDPRARFDNGSVDLLIAQLDRLVAPARSNSNEAPRTASASAVARTPAGETYGESLTRRIHAITALTPPTPVTARSTATLDSALDIDALGRLGTGELRPLGRNPRSGLFEFWHAGTGIEPKRRDDGHFVIQNETGVVLVLIPAGTFVMGAQKHDRNAPNFDPLASSDEGPVQRVSLDPFLIGKHPLTQGQWIRLAGSNPAANTNQASGREQHLAYPIENISWRDASGALARAKLVLPTEAQWEYAGRAGTTTPWWCGDEEAVKQNAAVDARSFAQEVFSILDVRSRCRTARVDTFAANPFGLFHVHGNVWEWCRDTYESYASTIAGPGDGLRIGSDPAHVRRGGSAYDLPRRCRTTYRSFRGANSATDFVGCRPAMTLR